jgi:hypothetical protein
MTPLDQKTMSNLLNRLSVAALLCVVAAGASARPGPQQNAFREAKREARLEQQMQRAERREQRVEASRDFRAAPPIVQQPAVPQPLPPVRPPLVAPQPGPIAPVSGQGGPRRLTPEERQQLRDQIRDARRMYQQGQ